MVEQHDKVPRTDDCSCKAHDIVFHPWRYRREQQLSIHDLALERKCREQTSKHVCTCKSAMSLDGWEAYLRVPVSVYIPQDQLGEYPIRYVHHCEFTIWTYSVQMFSSWNYCFSTWTSCFPIRDRAQPLQVLLRYPQI